MNKKNGLLLLMTIFVMLVASCTSPAAPEAPAAANTPSVSGDQGTTTTGPVSSKDTMIIAIPTDPGAIDRHVSVSYNWLSVYVVDNLMSQEYAEDGSIVAVCNDESLATDVQTDSDGLGITFTLRENVLFHNGKTLKPSDVVFSIRLQNDFSQFNFVDFDNIEVKDEKTVYVPLNRVDANAVYNIGKMVPIYSEEHYNTLNDEGEFYSTSAVSTGPYKIGKWVSGDSVQLEAHEGYYAGKPLIQNVIVRFINDPSVAFMELQNGGIDMMINPNWIDTEKVMDGAYPGLTSWTSSSALALQFGFNISGPLQDLRLRQAIAYAIDKAAIAQGAFRGSQDNLYGIVPLAFPGTIDFKDNWPYAYNPEKAKELLAEAGYEPGELEITALAGIGSNDRLAALEIMGSYLEAIGVKLVIKSIDIATYAATIENNPEEWDIWVRTFGSSMGAAPSPHDFFATTLPKVCHLNTNGGDPDAQKMVDLATQMGSAPNEADRMTVYKELQEFYLNSCLYTIPVTEANMYTLLSEKLQGAHQVGQDETSIAFAYFE